MKIREIIRRIRDDGWFLVRTRGSHQQYHHPAKSGTVTVAGQPGQDLHPKTLSSILKQAGLKYNMRYTIIIERGPENFSAYAPDFPGCVAAADTEAETIALMKEALELHIEDMRERGESVPPPSAAREIEVAA